MRGILGCSTISPAPSCGWRAESRSPNCSKTCATRPTLTYVFRLGRRSTPYRATTPVGSKPAKRRAEHVRSARQFGRRPALLLPDSGHRHRVRVRLLVDPQPPSPEGRSVIGTSAASVHCRGITDQDLWPLPVTERRDCAPASNGSRHMPRYYFHILDGTALLDETGEELADIEAARKEAVQLIAGVLRGGYCRGFGTALPGGLSSPIILRQRPGGHISLSAFRRCRRRSGSARSPRAMKN